MREMGSEKELEWSSMPKLPMLSISVPLPPQSPEHSGVLTPPIHTTAAVPFRWEEEPGKPRPCTALIALSDNNNNNVWSKCLELQLPPRLQLMTDSKMTKTPSPTTVLDGPYFGMPCSAPSSSLRIKRKRQGSFGSSAGSPERGQLGALVLSKSKGKGFFSSWGRRATTAPKQGEKVSVDGGDILDFSYSIDLAGFGGGGGDDEKGSSKGEKMSRMRRNGSFYSLSQAKASFLATLYEGFKQVLPWRSRTLKNGGLTT